MAGNVQPPQTSSSFLAENSSNLQPDSAYNHEMTATEVIAREEILLQRPLTDLEREEIIRKVNFLDQHKGHEGQHLEMILIFFTTLFASQLLISIWKKYHPRSYNMATLIGLWIIPFWIAIIAGNNRFVIIWILFSIFNGYIVRIALETPMKSLTPRWRFLLSI